MIFLFPLFFVLFIMVWMLVFLLLLPFQETMEKKRRRKKRANISIEFWNLLNSHNFIKIIISIGFELKESKNSPKIAFFCFQKVSTCTQNCIFQKNMMMKGSKRERKGRSEKNWWGYLLILQRHNRHPMVKISLLFNSLVFLSILLVIRVHLQDNQNSHRFKNVTSQSMRRQFNKTLLKVKFLLDQHPHKMIITKDNLQLYKMRTTTCLNVDFVGIVSLMRLIHCSRFANAEVVLSSFITTVWRAGWRPKSIGNLPLTILVSTGDNSSARFANLPCLMFLETMAIAILSSIYPKSNLIIWFLSRWPSRASTPEWFISCIQK